MAGVWLSIKQIAERDQCSKVMVSRRVKAFVADHGLEVTRDTRGRVAEVNVVQYDDLRLQTVDPAKAQAPLPEATLVPDLRGLVRDGSYDDHATQRMRWEAKKSEMVVLRDLGRTIWTDEAIEGFEIALDVILSVIERLPNWAEDMAHAVSKGGHTELRVYLRRTVVPEMRMQSSAGMREAIARLPERSARDEASLS